MPLSLAPIQQTLTVARIACDAKQANHLAALGLVKGAKIEALSSSGGAVILILKGSRIALDHSTAARIFVA